MAQARPGALRRQALVQTSPAEMDRRIDLRVDGEFARAEEQGVFRALPGQGRPLAFRPEEGLATLDDNWLANHFLKNAGYVPPWARLGRALDRARARSAALEAAWRDGGAEERGPLAEQVTAAWEAENILIRRWNAQVPHPSLERYPAPPDVRWRRLRANARAGTDPASGDGRRPGP